VSAKVLKDYPEYAEAYGIDIQRLANEERLTGKATSLFDDYEITSEKPKLIQYSPSGNGALPGLIELCIKSGEYADPIQFADAIMETYIPDTIKTWTITDSHGQMVYEGSAEMADMFRPYREYTIKALTDDMEIQKAEKANELKQGLIAVWTQWQVDDERGFSPLKDLKGAFAHLGQEIGATAYRLTNKDDAPPVFCGMPPCGPPIIEYLTPEGRFATKLTFFRNRLGKPVSIEMDYLALKEDNLDLSEKVINIIDNYCDKIGVEFTFSDKSIGESKPENKL
jgi:hypothetical protein